MRFGTVVARNFLAYARVLASSVRANNSCAEIFVLVLDDEDGAVEDADEPFTVLRPADIGIDRREFHRMATIYDVLELATAVKPWLMRRLLRDDDVACYLDPDIEVFSSLQHIVDLASCHSIVLIPHTTSPMPRDGLLPGEREIRLSGTFNLGFLALSHEADEFLSWWAERLRRECRNAVQEGLFVDQRWVDFVPGLFEHTINRDPGDDVAYWNLYDRKITHGAHGYEVNGQPLRFLHFSGFDPLRPYLLSKHQGDGTLRIRLEEHPVLARLCHRYAEKLLEAGYLDAISIAYRYDFTADGVRIDGRMRRTYAKALIDDERNGEISRLPDPFDPSEAAAFVAWFNAPAPASRSAVPRYLRAVYDERADIRAHVGDLEHGNDDRLFAWARDNGLTYGLPAVFVPPPERHWALCSGLPEGVNLVGYLRAEDGLGAVSRALLEVLQRAGIDVAARTLTATPNRQRAAPEIDDTNHSYDVTITCVNADQLPILVDYMGARMPLTTSIVGLWGWEVEAFPEWMARNSRLLDEVWVYSRHVANALAPALEVPIHVFAPPITVPDAPPEVDRAALDLSDEFLFFFAFDFHSVFERKNPLAVVGAFRRAFALGDGPQLLIKSVNGANHPRALARLQAATADRPDIIVRDGYENETRQRALTHACDCYVSLHRAEGYGLTLAEAMAAGRPVIATGYSGNLEFMTDDTGVLIPYEFTSIPYGCDPYPPGTRWAEPDLDYAAAAMRTMASDPAGAAALGARAQAHILQHHAPHTRVDFVRERLRDLRAQR